MAQAAEVSPIAGKWQNLPFWPNILKYLHNPEPDRLDQGPPFP
jgi:hypothetical protein